MADELAWGMSLFGFMAWWLYGNKSKYGPWAGLIHQAVVLAYTVATGHYGLLPGIVLFVFVHIRNYKLWTK
jgi:hypothetical protein